MKWNETRRIGAIFACFYVARVWQRQLGFLVRRIMAAHTCWPDTGTFVLQNCILPQQKTHHWSISTGRPILLWTGHVILTLSTHKTILLVRKLAHGTRGRVQWAGQLPKKRQALHEIFKQAVHCTISHLPGWKFLPLTVQHGETFVIRASSRLSIIPSGTVSFDTMRPSSATRPLIPVFHVL